MVENYSFSVAWSPEDDEYVATSGEFPGLSGLGPTAEDALRELRAAVEVAVEALIEDGEPVPVPRYAHQHSGQLRLRLPKSLHAAAVERAEWEGVSLNSFLTSLIAEGLGAYRARTSPLQTIAQSAAASLQRMAMGAERAVDLSAWTSYLALPVCAGKVAGSKQADIARSRFTQSPRAETSSGLPNRIERFLDRSQEQTTTVKPDATVPVLEVGRP